MEKECKGKVRFETMGRAQKAARAYKHAFGRKMNGYKCSFCDGFHIGHPRGEAAEHQMQRTADGMCDDNHGYPTVADHINRLDASRR